VAELPEGELLFHYTTRAAAFEHILPTEKLRFSPYRAMRDPLENKAWRPPPAAYWSSAAQGKPGDSGHPETNYWQFNAWASEIWDQAHLLAFTVDADDYSEEAKAFGRGCARARMWEQYGEAHAGVCLVFDRNLLVETINESLEAQDLASPYHHRVEYTEAGKRPWALEPDMLTSEVTQERVAKFIEDHHDELFFLKAKDWRSEYEYRFVVTAPPDLDGHFVNFGDSLRCIVAGERFPDWQIAGALDLAAAQGADALRLDWDNEPFLTTLLPDSERPW
jgi:DUF2971 family protein